MLTVMTPEFGQISVSAKGVRSLKNKNSAATSIFCYSEFVLKENANDIYSLSSCEIIESFYSLREDIKSLAQAAYMADLAAHVAVDDCSESLRLLLNAYHFLSKNDRDKDVLRCVFELRLLSEAGLAPSVVECVDCGGTEALSFFDSIAGGVVCKNCADEDEVESISVKAISLIRFILEANLKDAFGVLADKRVVNEIIALLENFISIHIGELKSLKYLKSIQ